jgi:hypothetical protein
MSPQILTRIRLIPNLEKPVAAKRKSRFIGELRIGYGCAGGNICGCRFDQSLLESSQYCRLQAADVFSSLTNKVNICKYSHMNCS